MMDELFYLTVGLIGALLTVIVYFLKRRDQQIDDIQRRHEEKFERLYDTISHIEQDVRDIPHLSKELKRIENITIQHGKEIDNLKEKI